MVSITLLQGIKNDLDKLFERIVRLRSREFNPVLLHLSKAIEEFSKIRKRIKKGEKQ